MPATKLKNPLPRRLNSKGLVFRKGDFYEPTGNKEHDELRQGRVFDAYDPQYQFCYQKRSDRTGNEYFSGKKAPWCRERWFTIEVSDRSQIASAYDRKVNDARLRGIELTITKEDFITLVNHGKKHGCNICGDIVRTPDIYARDFYSSENAIKTDAMAFSLDRIDNAKGYHMDNIQVACKDCNTKKGSSTLDYFTTESLQEELNKREKK